MEDLKPYSKDDSQLEGLLRIVKLMDSGMILTWSLGRVRAPRLPLRELN